MDVHMVNAIREDMERIEAHKLQPHFIEAFFIEAFTSIGGKIRKRENGRYEITTVPYAVRGRDMQIGYGEHVLNRYERVCFDKEFCNIPGLPQAALICPGHPLLEAVIDLVRERNVDVMKRGAIFIDDDDYSEKAKLLFYIEDAIQDGVFLANGNRRVISKHVHFVEIQEDGTAGSGGYAPYLDYRAADEEEVSKVRSWMQSQSWLTNNVENLAKSFAIQKLIPPHIAEVKSRKEKLLDKTSKAVKERMTAEIQYWDYRAADLAQKEAAGKNNAKLNSKLAQRRAEDLELRMQARLAEIEKERQISPMPPIITGGALVIPKGLLHKLMHTQEPVDFGHGDRQAVEYAAMHAVIQIEKHMGYRPTDVSAAKCGYDVESYVPEDMRKRMDAYALRLIEVKGRARGANTVTISKNEILTGLNKTEEFILAIVEVDGTNTKTIYLKNPFKGMAKPAFAEVSRNFNIVDLISNAEIIYQEYDLDSQMDPSMKNMTVMELVRRYLATRTGAKPSTLTNYRFVLNLLEKEDFSGKRIGDVKTSDAKLFLIKMQADGKGYSSVKTVRGVLRPAFQMAVDDDYLQKNPFGFQLVGVVINDSVTREAITKDQMRKFLKFVHDDNNYCRYYEAFYILFHTGMRISEFCGLTIHDLDMEKRIIDINKQLQRTSKMEYMIESTKTNAGTRKLPMTEEVFRCFQAILEDREAPRVEKMVGGYTGFLYLDKNGMPEVAMHWEHRFNHAVNRYNEIYREQLPNITPHVCRHTYCSNQAKAGMNPKTLQYLMGHSDIGVTMNVYTHLGMEDAAAEMTRMEEVESARREQEKLNGVKEGKEKQSRKMFRVV